MEDEISEKFKLPILSIITLDDIIEFLKNKKMMSDQLKSMMLYLEKYKR